MNKLWGGNICPRKEIFMCGIEKFGKVSFKWDIQLTLVNIN
jgi:hypothetical protein